VDGAGHTPVMGEDDRAAARELSLRGARPPAEVPGYAPERLLGHGAYGEVWVAVNRNSGRRVAVKFFTRRGGADWAGLAREVEKLRYLFSDRHVVQLFEVGWEADPPYYVMEYLENGSLEDLLRAGPLPAEDAAGYFREVAVGLVHAHDKGVLHCDLKPANILLDQDRRPRLADFGQSRLAHETAPALGTLFYMAPEQADLSAAPDARWDVYALGAVAYRMLTGAAPHQDAGAVSGGGLEAQLAAYRKLILSSPPPAAHRDVPGVNAELAGIVSRCLDPTPGRRFPNPQAVVTALDAWRLRRVRRPVLALTAAGAGLVMLALAAVGSYLFRTSVNTAREGVVEQALRANDFAAETEAGQLAFRTQLRWVQLDAASRNAEVRALLAAAPADPAAGEKLDKLLGERRARGNRQFPAPDQASVWFADDARGYQWATDPPYPAHRGIYRGYRDYFHGLGRELPDGTPAPQVVPGPHRSVAFRRVLEAGPVWSVAYSVPVGDKGAAPAGVVGMTVDLKEGRVDPGPRFAVLVDVRPDAKNGKRGLVLRHPYWAQVGGAEDPPLYYADDVVRWADSGAGAGEFPSAGDYADPIATDRPEFAGPWLASVAKVRVGPERVDTGWVVVVQERRDEVLGPVAALQWRLRIGAVVGALALLVITAVVWAGTVSVLDGAPKSRVTRLLRRWAGLPTGTAGSAAATGSLRTGGAEAGPRTVRAADTSPQGPAPKGPG
jgi:hypothetical protein